MDVNPGMLVTRSWRDKDPHLTHTHTTFSRRTMALLTPWFWPNDTNFGPLVCQNRVKINYSCFKTPSLWQFEISTLRNYYSDQMSLFQTSLPCTTVSRGRKKNLSSCISHPPSWSKEERKSFLWASNEVLYRC
jgi:hypothetical protein